MLSESAEFYKIKATVMRAVRLYERPPAFMFAPNYRVLTFVEFDVGLTGKFWRFLQNLSLAAKDPNIIVFAVEPDAEEYFHKEFGKYGAEPDSGTGELKGISGKMNIIIAPDGQHSYEFDYSIE